MDPNRTKPEGMGIPPMMRRMMEQMCGGTGQLDPAAMCGGMMGAAEKMTAAGECAMPKCCSQATAGGREAAPEPHGG